MRFFLYFILSHILQYRKKIILKNLSIILKSSDQSVLDFQLKKYYRHLSDLFFESIWSMYSSRESILSKIQLKNEHILDELISNNENSSLLISHIGDWELFCQWAPLIRPKLNVIVLYTAIKNGFFNRYFLSKRERTGAKLISTKETLDLFRLQKTHRPTINLFACDQNPGNPHGQYWTVFFDKHVPFISGAEKFVRSQNQRVFYLQVTKVEKKYELEIIEIYYDPVIQYDITHQYLRLLENNIQINPSLWLLSHNRFKFV